MASKTSIARTNGPAKNPLDIEGPITTVSDATAALAGLALESQALSSAIVVHHMALEGAFAGIAKMNLAGEDAARYAEEVVKAVEGLAHKADRQGQLLHNVIEFFTRTAPAVKRLRVVK